MLRGDLRAVLLSGGQQGKMSEVIDQSRDALGAEPNRFHGGRQEEDALFCGPGQGQAMGDAGLDFLGGQECHLMAHDESLREGLVSGHGEAAVEFGKADQNQGQPIGGVHFESKEQAQLIERIYN